MTEIYLHIVARMADYMDTHPYEAEATRAAVDGWQGGIWSTVQCVILRSQYGPRSAGAFTSCCGCVLAQGVCAPPCCVLSHSLPLAPRLLRRVMMASRSLLTRTLPAAERRRDTQAGDVKCIGQVSCQGGADHHGEAQRL